ncbi:MAG: bifunctional glutamine-synthetase adenylyltransferase/deadenyltransferase, partial [Aeromicrobium sp.]
LSRIGIADVLGRLDILEVGEALTDISVATLSGALKVATSAVEAERGAMPTRMAIVLMGRLGGGEAGYSSDADVMFVHDPLPGADETDASEAAMAVAVGLRKMLAAPSGDPPLEVDAELRPEGKNGPLVRTFAAYKAYYEKWSAVWEAQALLRANAVIGDEELSQRFTALIDPLRWPEGGTTSDEVREIRRIKARIDSERLPRGANPNTHLKLGRGGLADVEWTVQLLQMQHAYRVPEMRTTRTLQALHAAREADLINKDDAVALENAWRLVSRIRNAVVLMRGKAAESMVEQGADRAGTAHLLGYGMDQSELMIDDYRRTTRLARKVVERIFYE